MEYALPITTGSIRAKKIYHYQQKKTANIFKRFLSWCDAQDSNHFLWLALSFVLQIGLTLPLTAYAIIFFGGNNIILFAILAGVNVPVLVLNLAAMHTRFILPFVFFGWLTQALIILYCLAFTIFH